MSQAISLSVDDLKDVIATAVATAITESRKPDPPTQQELAQIEQMQKQREQNAAGVLQEMENKSRFQKVCAHEHQRKDGGGTHCVWIREEDHRSHGYILCQKCQARIRPDAYDAKGLPHQRDRRAIFDTVLFNRLFQECGEQAVMG